MSIVYAVAAVSYSQQWGTPHPLQAEREVKKWRREKIRFIEI